MQQTGIETPPVRGLGRSAMAAIGTIIFIALAYWGGMPPAERMPLFVAGVAILVVVIAGMVVLGWHLLFRPLPAGQKNPATSLPAVATRQLLAIGVGFAGINLVVGGFWDEVWHREYGIPFGEDLFWRPHMLIYSSIVIIVAVGGWGLRRILNGRGSLQQRFRADSLTGLLILGAAFLMFALPADPLWHILYGDDISALSVPHVVLAGSFFAVIVLAMAAQQSTQPARAWRRLPRLSGSDWLIVVFNVFALNIALQIMTTDWDGELTGLVIGRPDWLLPAIIVGMAVFNGVLANHALRTAGAATLTGVVALAVRFGLLLAFNYDGISTGAWIGMMGPLIGVDLVTLLWLSVRQAPVPSWAVGIGGAAGLLIGTVPIFGRLFPYPTLDAGNLPAVAVSAVLVAIFAAAAGGGLGDYLATANKASAEATTVVRRPSPLVPALALAALVVGITLFVVTAPPPV